MRAVWIAVFTMTFPGGAWAQSPGDPDALTTLCDGIDGGSPDARAEGCRVLRQMLRDVSPEIVARLRRGRTHLLPQDMSLTDLPEYARFKGVSLDTEMIDEKRGATDKSCDDAGVCLRVSYVGEENLLGQDLFDERANRSRRVFVHEFSHQIYWAGFTLWERTRFQSLYEEARAGGAPFSDSYAEKNPREFFAKATEVWFGVHQADNEPVKDAAWLKTAHPTFFAALRALYGAPRAISAR